LTANDVVHGTEPWRSNGGPVGAGTDPVADIEPSGSSFPAGYADVNGTAFFRAFPGGSPGPFGSTGFGATKLTPSFSTRSAPSLLTNVGGTLFFAAQDCCSSTGQELWKATIEAAPPPPATGPSVAPPPPLPPSPAVPTPKCKKSHKKHAAA